MANNSKQIWVTILIAALVAVVVTLLVIKFLGSDLALSPPYDPSYNDRLKGPDFIIEKLEIVPSVNGFYDNTWQDACYQNRENMKCDVVFKLYVKNQGNEPSPYRLVQSEIVITKIGDEEGWTRVLRGGGFQERIQPGETKIIKVTADGWPLSLKAGKYSVLGYVDFRDTVTELNEENNENTIIADVPPDKGLVFNNSP